MTLNNSATTQTATTFRQALGPGFGLAGPSEHLLNTLTPATPATQAAGHQTHRR